MNGRRTAADVIRLGQRLLAVKRTLPRGGFHKWLVAEFDNQAETARKAIQAAEVFGDRLPADRSLPIDASAIYVLSKNYVSDTIRAQVIERAKAGVRITHRAVRAMVGGVRQGAARMRRTINIRPTGPFAAQRPKRPPTATLLAVFGTQGPIGRMIANWSRVASPRFELGVIHRGAAFVIEALHQRCGLVIRQRWVEDGAGGAPAVIVRAHRDTCGARSFNFMASH